MKLQVQQPSSTSQPVTSQSTETTEQSNVDMPETPKQQDAIAPEASTYGMDRAGEETEASTTGGTGAVELPIEDDRAGEETEASATGGTGAVELMGAQTEGNRASQVDAEHICALYQASRYLSFRGYSGWSIYAEASAAGGTGAVEPWTLRARARTPRRLCVLRARARRPRAQRLEVPVLWRLSALWRKLCDVSNKFV